MTNYREFHWFLSRTGLEATREQAMNITSPILYGALRAAEVHNDSTSSFLTLAYLGLNPTKPVVEFEIRLPKSAFTTAARTQAELTALVS